jgi:ribosomal protein S5
MVKATMAALQQLRTNEEIKNIRFGEVAAEV